MSNTEVPTKVNTFADGQSIIAAPINQNFDDLFTALANIGTANMLDDAVTTAKVANSQITLAKLAAAVQAALCPSGTVVPTMRTDRPEGWVFSGTTIGNASSGADRANADTETLFLLAYAAFANAQAAVSGGRGASAAADYAAGKRLTLPSVAGRTIAGLEASESLITTAASGFSGATMGATGGSQSHTLSVGELATHNHTITDPAHTHTDAGHSHGLSYQLDVLANGTGGSLDRLEPGSGLSTNSGAAALQTNTTGISLATAGSNTPHRNVQPTLILKFIVKL